MIFLFQVDYEDKNTYIFFDILDRTYFIVTEFKNNFIDIDIQGNKSCLFSKMLIFRVAYMQTFIVSSHFKILNLNVIIKASNTIIKYFCFFLFKIFLLIERFRQMCRTKAHCILYRSEMISIGILILLMNFC